FSYAHFFALSCTLIPSLFSARAWLPDFRRERDNLGELTVAQLAGHRPEDARAHGLIRLVDEHGGVVVEADVGAVAAALLFSHPDDHALHHFPFLDLAFGRRFLHRSGHDIAQPGLQSGIAP